MARKRSLSPQQDLAANPTENVWVQANAGTGKTSVLVQRLLRILFRANDDHNTGILCLTYTNAGASEMRNRILAALRTWAMADDDALGELLDGISENRPANAGDVARAREIFFRYIDQPDMLKIKTIHGFCEEILHRFPLEAGISPAWSLVQDAAQKILLDDAFRRLINSPSSVRVRDAFAHIVGRISEHSLDDLLGILTAQYKNFFQIENLDNYREYFIDKTRKFLQCDLTPPPPPSREMLENIIENAQIDANSSKKPAAYLLNVINLTKQFIDTTVDFEKYKTAWLTATDTKIANVAKKDYLVAEQDRVHAQNQYNLNRAAFDDTVALFDLSAAFADTYRRLKSERNVLDFDDLILYTRKLFSSPDTMGWVLSQLDLSLSHILVDEAQDTSPQQWDILRMLAGDFFTDGVTASAMRSLFVVGDTKQSIYGFQGADPAAFAASRAQIAAQIQNNARTIREVPLAQSFRSTAPVLGAVDAFFNNADIVAQTGFINNDHKCFRADVPGLVQLHKLVCRESEKPQRADYIKTIADQIETLVRDQGLAPGDIMVLVQRRNPFAAPLVRELKGRGLDVAGSDRIVLPEFPAVRDMLNLVRFCLNQADDYSLCCVLKSPIFRLNEREIFNLCTIKNSKNKTVFDVVSDAHPDIYVELKSMIEWSRVMGPYSFMDRVLGTGNRRQKMIAALGEQIIDPMEEFMTICLAYERTQPGTLRHFLKWFITGGSEIKRDMDASQGVRIVTVHGSKGLEAPVVFLIDTIRTPRDKPEKIFPVPPQMLGGADAGLPIWLWAPQKNASEKMADAANHQMNIKIAEYYRLLYVAMTRARDRLYIYGFTTNKNPPEIAWHTQLWEKLGDMHPFENDCIRITNDTV